MPSLKRITLDYTSPYSAPPPPPPRPCKCNLFTPPPQTPPPVSPFQAPSKPNSVPFRTPSAPPPYFIPTTPASTLAPSPSPQTSNVAGNGAVIGVSVSLGSIFLAILSYGLYVFAKKPLSQFRIGGGKGGGATGTGVSQHDGEAGGGGIRGESAAEVSSKVQPVFVSNANGSDPGTSSTPDPTREDPGSEHLCSQFASFLSKANVLADNLLSQCQTSDPSKAIHHNKLREEQSSLTSQRDKLNQRLSETVAKADQKTPPEQKLTTSSEPPSEDAGAEKANERLQGQDIKPPSKDAGAKIADGGLQGQDIQPPSQDAGAEIADGGLRGQDIQAPSEDDRAEKSNGRVQGQDIQPPSENAGEEKADERVQGQDTQPPPEDAGAEETDAREEVQDIQQPSEDPEVEKVDEISQGQDIEPEEDEEETVKKLLKSKIMRKILARKAPMLYRQGFMACKKQLQSRGLLHHSAMDELLDVDFGLRDAISQLFGENEEDEEEAEGKEEEAEGKEEETLTSSSKQQMLSNKQFRSPERMEMKRTSPSARKNGNPLNKVKNSIDAQDLISLHRQDDADDDLTVEATAEEAKIEEAEQEEDLAAAEEDAGKILSAVETSSITQQTANKASRKTQSPVKNTIDTQDLINVTASSSIQRTGNKTNINQQFRPPASVRKKPSSLTMENKAKNIIDTQDSINVNRTSSDDTQAAGESQEGIELIAEEAKTEEAAGEYREGIEVVSDEVKDDEAAGESEEGIEMVAEEAKAEAAADESPEGIEVDTHNLINNNQTRVDHTGDEAVSSQDSTNELPTGEESKIEAEEAVVVLEEDLMMAEQEDTGKQGKDFENSLSNVNTLLSSRSTQQTMNQTGPRIKQFRSPESMEMKTPPRPGNKNVSPLNKVNVIHSQAVINLNKISRDDAGAAGDEAEVGDRDEDLEKMLGKVKAKAKAKASSSIQQTGNKANSKQELRSPESMGKKTSTVVIINKAKNIIGTRDPKNVTQTSSDEAHGGARQSEEGIEVVAEEAKAEEADGESQVVEEIEVVEAARESQVAEEAKVEEAIEEAQVAEAVTVEEVGESQVVEAEAEEAAGESQVTEEAKAEEAVGKSQVAEEAKAEKADA